MSVTARLKTVLGRALRPVLASLLVGLTTVLGVAMTAAPAQACSCASPLSFKKQLAQADLVVVATVDPVAAEKAAEEKASQDPAGGAGDGAPLDVVVSRVYKGTVGNARMSISGVDGPCGVWSGAPDQKMLLLVKNNAAGVCTGSRVADNRTLEAVQARLGVGKRVAPPPPTEVVRTAAEQHRPRDFARLAAPGAAAVLLGLLGLAVVSRVQRH